MDKKYQDISDVVKADIERVNKNLSFDVDLFPKLSRDVEKFLNAPSKRIRSLVSILYLRASKMYLLPSHYDLFTAVELIHNASLIHDDIIDESTVRRNKSTINEKFGDKVAVTTGDYVLGLALKKLIKINSPYILSVFADTITTMCKGEVSQYFNRFKKQNIEQYIEKTSQKTASLFESALKSAILLAEGEYDDKAQEFIVNFGIAFQIKDDLMNVLNSKKSKNISDTDGGIYNAPMILDDDLEAGIEKTKILMNNYLSCAGQCLEDLKESPYKTALYGLLEWIRNV